MKILAFESATGPCSAAILKDGHVVASLREEQPRAQASRLVPLINECLVEAGMNYADIDAFATLTGPGSFTGLRISLAAAHGFALALGKPVYGISTLQLLAMQSLQATDKQKIVANLSAGKGQLYAQVFKAAAVPRALTEPQILFPDELHNLQAPDIYITPETLAPDAAALAMLCETMIKENSASTDLSPLYIRPPDAKPQNKVARLAD